MVNLLTWTMVVEITAAAAAAGGGCGCGCGCVLLVCLQAAWQLKQWLSCQERACVFAVLLLVLLLVMMMMMMMMRRRRSSRRKKKKRKGRRTMMKTVKRCVCAAHHVCAWNHHDCGQCCFVCHAACLQTPLTPCPQGCS